MSPRTERNKRIVRSFARAIGNDDPVGPFRFVSPGYRLHGGALTGDHDLPSAVAWWQEIHRAFPDLEVQLDPQHMVAENDRVAVTARWRGTHRGRYRGISPTGRQVDLSIMAIFHLRNGRIVEEFHLTDSLALVEQLRGGRTAGPGAAESPGPASSSATRGLPPYTERFFVPPETLPGPWW